jgi:hypothetical protein
MMKKATFNSPGRWQAFLSHTQRNKIATTYVHRLAPSLKQRGFPNIWHDVQRVTFNIEFFHQHLLA